jgi:Na+/H+-translocating membrane pyrophosphatase
MTSILCGFIGMKIATYSNYRTAYQAHVYKGLPEAFKCAYRAGCVMGFCLVSIGLFVIIMITLIYYNIGMQNESDIKGAKTIFEGIAGYGLVSKNFRHFREVVQLPFSEEWVEVSTLKLPTWELI